MSTITMDVFYDNLMNLLTVLEEKETPKIKEAAKILAETTKNNGVIHVFGSGHSVGFSLEMQNRIGSLANVHKIETSDFVLKGKVTLEDFKDPVNVFERRPGMAEKLFDLYSVKNEDCFIIISNSGINGVVIDMAICAKERGNKVIVVTSWQHTSAEDSRHPSGKKLYELGDVVIDNCGPRGDALIETGKLEKICSVSSITGAFIAQTLECETVKLLQEENIEAPIFYDESLEGAKQHNEMLRAKYHGRV